MSEEPIWFHTPPHIKAWVGELQAEIERLKGYLEFLRIHCDAAYTYENIEKAMKSLDSELREIVDYSDEVES